MTSITLTGPDANGWLELEEKLRMGAVLHPHASLKLTPDSRRWLAGELRYAREARERRAIARHDKRVAAGFWEHRSAPWIAAAVISAAQLETVRLVIFALGSAP